ncbi:MAG: AAA-like domain-containing protein [Desulfobulbaceae bacterium]|jgi:type II secretory pathway predicted ATPase ExeA|nr:AAA-like domain-containing protein [Desulfobulbaceae bacterium]
MPYFNISGPCNKRDHYMIEAATRLKGVEQLIDMNQYFVIHAARQSGKTTYLQDLAARLNAAGNYYALHCSLEGLQGIAEPEKGISQVVRTIKNALRFSGIPHAAEFATNADYEDFTGVLLMELSTFCMALDKPLVILFDEADCLSESTLISFLRQLRLGYNNRAMTPFVHSIALVGMRNIRDYKAKIRPDSASLGSASPFNIVTESLTLTNFTRDEIGDLYGQHTEESGQRFDTEAIDLIWEKSQGQPWLVNAIAREVIVKILASDYTKPVTAALAEQAISNIMLRRDTHIDSLLERLKEERVRRVIEPMLMGKMIDITSDDFCYVRDLGLIRVTPQRIEPANPIYGDVMVRTLNHYIQETITRDEQTFPLPRYLQGGRIDIESLMRDFQQFWRENSEIWREKVEYKEAAPHLILMAFLQRVLNGGGHILREFAAGSGRTDLCLVYQGQKYPIELKIRRGDKTVAEGLKQLARYMDTLACADGWLAVFDQRADMSWDEKIYLKTEHIDGKIITVVGL